MLKAEEVPFLARFGLLPRPTGSDDAICQHLLHYFHDIAECLKNASQTHLQATNDTLISSPDRLDVLRSVVEQYQKVSMHYETLQHVYSPSINRTVVNTAIARIKEMQRLAQSELSMLEVEVGLAATKVATAPAARTSKQIFSTKKHGLVIGKIRAGNAAGSNEVMEVTDFLSGKVIFSYEEATPGNWLALGAPDLSGPSPATVTRCQDWIKMAQEYIDSADRYIANADNQGRQGYLPAEVEEILVQQAERMKKHVAQLRTGPDGVSLPEAIAMVSKLEEKSASLVTKGHEIRIEMTLKAAPTPVGLDYLNNLGMLKIRKTLSKRRLADRSTIEAVTNKAIKEADFLDEYEVVAMGQIWAYAHLHYPNINIPDTFFTSDCSAAK